MASNYERRPAPGYPHWEADTDGKVYYYGAEKPGWMRGGYVYVWARYDDTKRAWIVADAFHGAKPLDKDVCAHRNDIKDDDRPENLYWATDSENKRDAVQNGLMMPPYNRGETHGRAKLAEADVRAIRDDYASRKYNQYDLADIYGVSRSTIRDITNRSTWAHVA